MSTYQEYTTANDRKQANQLIKVMLDKGYSISVNDGEEDTLDQSTSSKVVKDHLGTTGEDYLSFHNKEGKSLGYFWLIWCNGEDCLISDYSANTASDEINSLLN